MLLIVPEGIEITERQAIRDEINSF